MLTLGGATPVRAALPAGLVIGLCVISAGCGETGTTTVSGGNHATQPTASAAGTPAAMTTTTSAAPPTNRHADVRTIGHSVMHHAIRVRVVGDPSAERRILVVGCIHGNETAGEAITRRLRSGKPPTDTSWWIVDQFNPDGCRARTRQNANAVDLNRNSPWHWRRIDKPGGTYYSGPGPLSEPESQAINRLVRRLRPSVSVWYHQHAALVDTSSGGDRAIERRYAMTVKLPLRDYGVFPGSITTWQDATYPGSTAFCVELPAGTLSPDAVARHVKAIREL